MKSYDRLEEQIREAIAYRNRKRAEDKAFMDSFLPEEMTGKIAENHPAQNNDIPQENKDSGEVAETGCLVEPTHPTQSSTQSQSSTSHIANLLAQDHVQARIGKAKEQDQRVATREENNRKKLAVPVTPWKRASVEEKFKLAVHAADKAGGMAFTLKLNEKKQEYLKRSFEPLRDFSDALNRAFKDAGVQRPPYALTLEISNTGDLHVHGVLVVDPASMKAAGEALRAAGGKIPGRAGSRQLRFKKLIQAVGWANYSNKDQDKTNEALRGRARPFLSQSMIGLAREFSLGQK